jgi:hypothetical protein
LQKLINKCEEYAELWRISFNSKKSFIYKSNKTQSNEPIFTITGKVIPNTDGLEYLGLPIGDNNYTDSFIQNNFRSVEKAFYSIRSIGLHKEFSNPLCISFIYKQYCQSIFNYGLELLPISKTLMKQLETRQGLLIKNVLGLSKYSRNSPLLDALSISKITKLYYKFKFLFRTQIKKNYFVENFYSKLKTHYLTVKPPKQSYINQYNELSKIINTVNLNEINRKDFYSKLELIFSEKNKGLVDSVRFIVHRYDELPYSNELLRGLLRVDFGTGAGNISSCSDDITVMDSIDV